MGSAEQKLDDLTTKVDVLADKFERMMTLMDTFNRWRPGSDKFAVKLSQSVMTLTSRVTALEETLLVPPPQARRTRKVGGPTATMSIHITRVPMPGLWSSIPPWSRVRILVPQTPTPLIYQSLVIVEITSSLGIPNFPALISLDLMVVTLESGKRSVKSTFPCLLSLHNFGLSLSPFTLKAIELWLQTYEAQHDIDSWAELCVAVDTKFSRDMYQNYMKDLLNIRQTGDLHEYYDNFYQAMHRVLVHNDKYDDVFFVMRFIDGLKLELRSAIQLHKPRTVDAAMTLALLQVDVLESANRRYYSKLSKDFTKYSSKQQSNSGILGTAPSDSKTPPTSDTQQKGDDKLAAMHAQ